MTKTKIELLAKHLEINTEEIEQSSYNENLFEVGNNEYLVVTDEEADEETKDYIKETVWAFSASFLANFTDLPKEMFTAIQDKCENANDPILTVIERVDGGLDEFVSQAVKADGRGHFLSSYDGNENEVRDEDGELFYIYRKN